MDDPYGKQRKQKGAGNVLISPQSILWVWLEQFFGDYILSLVLLKIIGVVHKLRLQQWEWRVREESTLLNKFFYKYELV